MPPKLQKEVLANKEAATFRQILRNYESKHYKKGLKACDQLLKKHPQHGETTSMKGLILNHLTPSRKAEAYDLAKKGLRYDLTSHICWHVLGMIYRSDRNYEEALKCYQNAIKFDKNNINILKDMAVLQIQCRLYEPYTETRMRLLELRPQIRQNWTALAVAHHLQGDPAKAVEILAAFEHTLNVKPGRTDQEHSEALLYRNSLMAEYDLPAALDHLYEIEADVNNPGTIYEFEANYLAKLNDRSKQDDLIDAWERLVDRNPDNKDYLFGLEKVKLQTGVERRAFWDELATKYPKAAAIKSIPLEFLEGDQFRIAVDKYLRAYLSKGVPSTFVSLKSLYNDVEKRQIIQDLAESYLVSLKSDSTFPPPIDSSNQPNGTSEKSEPPTTLLWTLYFLALHYAHPKSQRDVPKSLEIIEQAIQHTPTLVELHLTKARLLKYQGKLSEAVDAIMLARDLDLQDRFVNTRVGKYLLRVNRNDEALQILKDFTRPDAPGGPLAELTDMQCMWFALEDGESYQRQGKFGLALKRFHTIWKHFEDWEEDQYDFHTYSFRKGPIRDYIKLLSWEDRLRSHPYFVRAAKNAISIYIKLYDDPKLVAEPTPNFQGMDETERKKAVKKAKKAARKAEEQAAQQAANETKDPSAKKDDDAKGELLVKTDKPLEDALKFLKPLQELSPKLLETQLLAFDVHFRRGKYFQAVAALNAANSIKKGDEVVTERVKMLREKFGEVEMKNELKSVIEDALKKLETVQNGI